IKPQVGLPRFFPLDEFVTHPALHDALPTAQGWEYTAPYVDKALVKKSVIAQFIVAGDAVRGSDFQVGHHWISRQECFIAGYPTYRKCRERTEAIAWGKLFRPIIAEIEFGQIAIVVVVGGTCH